MFDHAIEGWLSAPEYGGNQRRSGWTEISFRGDVVPKGYTAAEVRRSDGFDPIDPTGIVTTLLAHLADGARWLRPSSSGAARAARPPPWSSPRPAGTSSCSRRAPTASVT